MKADVATMLAEVMQPRLLRHWLLSQPSDRRFLTTEGDKDIVESYLLEATGREWASGWDTIGFPPPSGEAVTMPDWLLSFSHDTVFGMAAAPVSPEQALSILAYCVPVQEAMP